jgi:hypothetical protein
LIKGVRPWKPKREDELFLGNQAGAKLSASMGLPKDSQVILGKIWVIGEQPLGVNGA